MSIKTSQKTQQVQILQFFFAIQCKKFRWNQKSNSKNKKIIDQIKHKTIHILTQSARLLEGTRIDHLRLSPLETGSNPCLKLKSTPQFTAYTSKTQIIKNIKGKTKIKQLLKKWRKRKKKKNTSKRPRSRKFHENGREEETREKKQSPPNFITQRVAGERRR